MHPSEFAVGVRYAAYGYVFGRSGFRSMPKFVSVSFLDTRNNSTHNMDSSDTSTFTELIFFHLPEEVKPEDPDNLKGKEFLGLFQQAKQQDGHCWSAWGRTEENKSALVWVVDNTGEAQTLTWSQFSTTEWSDDKATVSTSGLESMACPNPAIVKLRTKFTPSLSSVGGITSAPVVYITTMSFVAGVAAEEDAEIMSTWDSRPVVAHPDSRTGESLLSILMVGWQSAEQHYEIWKWSDFRAAYIGPVKAHMLSYPEGIGMKHVPFTLV
ncbi:hypothetical protein B0J15DRAFT_473190 [Fusarium solani]|uniref:Uncharacterized protein n=1 Tax=Fusarium solani TaxID=169388 RepID=A0A9P9G019_FUSSL|nr:uncharacterized protein B0J15DRAFT_473190 [Fusarium solani]KAH7230026.1 hypothetical protein B0J15DRAFT_473190 [Fusarium solani]